MGYNIDLYIEDTDSSKVLLEKLHKTNKFFIFDELDNNDKTFNELYEHAKLCAEESKKEFCGPLMQSKHIIFVIRNTTLIDLYYLNIWQIKCKDFMYHTLYPTSHINIIFGNVPNAPKKSYATARIQSDDPDEIVNTLLTANGNSLW